MGFQRLFSSFRASVLWPLLVAGVVSAALLWMLAPGVLEESAAAHLSDTLPILAPWVVERLDLGPAELQTWLGERTEGTELRVTVIRGDGTVVADSSRTAEQVGAMDNHRERPEVAEALAVGSGRSVRRSDTTGLSYVYVARRDTDLAGGIFVLRLAQPLRELATLRDSVLQVMLISGVVGLGAAALVLLGLNRRLFRPLEEMVEGANRLARGDYSGHLELPEAEELASVAGSLNRLSDRVGEQLDQIRAERNHLQEILSILSDGILVTDADGHVRFVNQAFRELFEVEIEVEGRSPLELTRRPEIVDLITDCLGDAAPRSRDRLAFDGGRVLAASVAPVGGGGVLLVVRDVTERVHLDETDATSSPTCRTRSRHR